MDKGLQILIFIAAIVLGLAALRSSEEHQRRTDKWWFEEGGKEQWERSLKNKARGPASRDILRNIFKQ